MSFEMKEKEKELEEYIIKLLREHGIPARQKNVDLLKKIISEGEKVTLTNPTRYNIPPGTTYLCITRNEFMKLYKGYDKKILDKFLIANLLFDDWANGEMVICINHPQQANPS